MINVFYIKKLTVLLKKMAFNPNFTKLGQDYDPPDNEAALANIEASTVNYSIVCNRSGKNGMHYLISGQSRTELFWKIFNDALSIIDKKSLNLQDGLHGRNCLHYAASNLFERNIHQDLHCLVAIASRTYHGYMIPDNIGLTGRKYLQRKMFTKINIAKVIDVLYRTLVCKIQRCWRQYKRRVVVKNIIQEIVFLPPTNTFPGGQQYYGLKTKFEQLQ